MVLTDPARTLAMKAAAMKCVQLLVSTLEQRLTPAGLNVPGLSSNSGAAKTLYLDFDGHFESRWWLIDHGVTQSFTKVSTPAFDLDGDDTWFNAEELQMIRSIFRRVAEDFAPFDVNVTTKEP